ncbi:MAG: HD domain-containing protein [Paludibacteraceae bacterium]|nr:HD domain-containing protein [Paludibacteraceae bacterium]MBP5664501.1 HD domain-containing protein [Bacteroidales bacterium]
MVERNSEETKNSVNMELKPEIEKQIKEQLVEKEQVWSKYACKSSDAIQFYHRKEDIRPAFFHDVDKIIHSRCYSRYIDKTQVFYLIENDHITHRVLHVQLVSKIARTIGRFLNLNEDLIEAISLGHDVGHTPFGHNGERIISDFCERKGEGIFEHNVQSFRLFHEIEKKGDGVNMCVQTLDGIICHNGELLVPRFDCDRTKTKEKLFSEYTESLKNKGVSAKMKPMTLEGCVMRISDIIAYIGRDIEDAIKLQLIDRKDIPREITKVLGDNNKEIINNLIIDLVNNSYGNDYISFSTEVFNALDELKKWNNKNIYSNPEKMAQDDKIKKMFDYMLETNLVFLNENNTKSNIIKWLDGEMSHSYIDKSSNVRIVADYVSGMTDDYLMNSYKELVLPKSFGINFSKKA